MILTPDIEAIVVSVSKVRILWEGPTLNTIEEAERMAQVLVSLGMTSDASALLFNVAESRYQVMDITMATASDAVALVSLLNKACSWCL